MYTPIKALQSISTENRFGASQELKLIHSTSLVLNNIPQVVQQNPAFCIALRGQGRYISVNIMNYLLFRTPAYKDNGGEPVYDCHMIFEQNTPIINRLPEKEERITFQFQDFACINLGLWHDGILNFTTDDWKSFQDACIMAMTAKRTRTWLSNILLAP